VSVVETDSTCRPSTSPAGSVFAAMITWTACSCYVMLCYVMLCYVLNCVRFAVGTIL
jgi:hypothetical protein